MHLHAGVASLQCTVLILHALRVGSACVHSMHAVCLQYGCSRQAARKTNAYGMRRRSAWKYAAYSTRRARVRNLHRMCSMCRHTARLYAAQRLYTASLGSAPSKNLDGISMVCLQVAQDAGFAWVEYCSKLPAHHHMITACPTIEWVSAAYVNNTTRRAHA